MSKYKEVMMMAETPEGVALAEKLLAASPDETRHILRELVQETMDDVVERTGCTYHEVAEEIIDLIKEDKTDG